MDGTFNQPSKDWYDTRGPIRCNHELHQSFSTSTSIEQPKAAIQSGYLDVCNAALGVLQH